jgi:hypothetical protein
MKKHRGQARFTLADLLSLVVKIRGRSREQIGRWWRMNSPLQANGILQLEVWCITHNATKKN